ncbi:MAG: helicase-related protein, partial [Candidatus Njordarchaeales archaeon]
MNIDSLARDKFQERIRKGLLGPGSDSIVLEKDIREEIISDYPLVRYYTGILFPEKVRLSSQNKEDDALIEAETLEEDMDVIEGLNIEKNYENEIVSNSYTPSSEERFRKYEDDEIKISSNNFFPTNMGLTFCLDKKVKEIEVEFSFGLYYQPSQKEITVAIDPQGFKSFVNDRSPFPFKDILQYSDGYMSLKREVKGYKGGRGKERSGEYIIFDDFKKSDELRQYPLLKANLHLFELLIGRIWKRKDISERIVIEVPPPNEIRKEVIYEEMLGNKETLKVIYTAKTYILKDRSYMKIQMVNKSDKHSAKKFSNKNELLNRKCLFQSKIRVETPYLKPYKSYEELYPSDQEAEMMNYLYQNVYNYGIGHNCSVIWDTQNTHPRWIETSFLPEYDVKDLMNDLSMYGSSSKEKKSADDFLDIYNMSIFGTNKDAIIHKLTRFVESYGNWIKQQKSKISGRKIEDFIISNLHENYKRLQKNVGLLENDDVFQAFLLTNTAMYIQLIISKDLAFCGKEKMLSEINPEITYDNIDFFKNYDFSRLPFGRPNYRPFQLAFFLLNIEGIINEKSKSRNEIVDLLWFPTGGGKTEAYLTVAAFTIIWRRLSNKEGYKGTSVIMRYTLRLLTAQQFERAARLIVALEFLRGKYPTILKDNPITIGLWVGMASTPNTLKEAYSKVEDITGECNKGDKGYPENKNVFQISACPWCGTKLINKNKHNNWDSGFVITGRGRNKRLKIKCLNEGCYYHQGLPLQVVDEMIYEDPSTLLFATIDKFAMLAWEKSGHKFFNSLSSDDLPPDLIIQDELHLLNGPLGSIVGIYESIVEL